MSPEQAQTLFSDGHEATSERDEIFRCRADLRRRRPVTRTHDPGRRGHPSPFSEATFTYFVILTRPASGIPAFPNGWLLQRPQPLRSKGSTRWS